MVGSSFSTRPNEAIHIFIGDHHSDNHSKVERMKKSSATIYSPSMELPVITRRSARRANRIKNNTSTLVEKLSNAVPPPSEETIERLNQLGKQYPFCVSYKHKDHDPL